MPKCVNVCRMTTETEIEKDAIALWVRTVRPGLRTNAELARSYDDWSDRIGAPELRSVWTLSRCLDALKYERWRTAAGRGFRIPSRHRLLLEKAGPVTRGAAYFVGRMAPGRWTDDQAYAGYVAAMEGDAPLASRRWFIAILCEIGVPVWGGGFDIGGSREPVLPA